MSDNDTFKAFEEEFGSITSSLARKLSSIPLQQDKDRETLISEAEADIADANNCLNNIEMEIRHYQYAQKTKANNTLRELRSKFDQQKQEFESLKKGRKTPKNDDPKHRDQRNRLLGVKKHVDDTTLSLDNTTRTLQETAVTGAATSVQLQEQREVFIRSRQNLRDTDDVLARSRKLLIRMRRRLVTNKLISFIIIMVELGIIALIVWLKYYK